MRNHIRGVLVAAAIVCPWVAAHAAACVTSTLNVYTAANFDCTIGDLTFSEFAYANAGNVTIAASSIQVNPIDGAKRGMSFFDPVDFNIAGQANKLYDGSFSYLITVADKGKAINGIELSQGGGQALGPSGVENVTKKYCATGGKLGDCPAPQGGVLPGIRSLTVYPEASTSAASFAAVTKIGVRDILILRTGNDNTSSVHVSVFQNLVSQVPEPSTWLMFASGMVVWLGWAGRRASARRG